MLTAILIITLVTYINKPSLFLIANSMKIQSILLACFILLSTAFAKGQPAKHSNIDGLYKFSGNINGSIPVFLWVVVKDSVVKGEVTYLKTAKRTPITVAGAITKDEGLRLEEFAGDGNITGIYNGNFNTGKLTGTWSKPGSERELKYSLTPKDTVLSNIDMDLQPVAIGGEYAYLYGKSGATGSIDIKSIGKNNYLIEISSVTESPANNLADIGTSKVHMYNNTIIYKISDADCRFKIKVFKGFIVISMLTTNLDNCGFGFDATIEGIYVKTSEKANFYTR